ncbi:single-stranded DNA-binding protein [Candidatus Shapirobacteria bacterium]|nr:single-stranded DNA-binding protein [Candidatus Shapirobacteria bacterium]
MPFSINLAVITGNVTRDPELRYTPSGSAVCSFGVATNHSVKKGDQWEDHPTFHNIVVWGKQAEYISNNVKKGTKVSITGRIDNRQYDAKDGTKKYISEIVADTVIPFTDHRASSANDDGQSTPKSNQSTPVNDIPDKVEDIIIPDEMPF